MKRLSAISKLMLIAAVAMVPLWACCCMGGMSDPHASAVATHGCCPTQGVPTAPASMPCEQDGQCPVKASQLLACGDTQPVAVPNLSAADNLLSAFPLVELAYEQVQQIDDSFTSHVSNSLPACRAGTLRALSCLLTV